MGFVDPFATPATFPAVKFPTPGTAHLMTITEIGELRQRIDFETNLPMVSKAGNPKMQLRVLVDLNGEDHALYVPQYSNLWKAIQAAKGNAPLEPMGVLWVQYTGDEPVEGNKVLRAKAYTAKYKAPDKADPFAGQKYQGTSVADLDANQAALTEAPF